MLYWFAEHETSEVTAAKNPAEKKQSAVTLHPLTEQNPAASNQVPLSSEDSDSISGKSDENEEKSARSKNLSRVRRARLARSKNFSEEEKSKPEKHKKKEYQPLQLNITRKSSKHEDADSKKKRSPENQSGLINKSGSVAGVSSIVSQDDTAGNFRKLNLD